MNHVRIAAIALLLIAPTLAGQRGERGGRGPVEIPMLNLPYDGSYTFARIRYATAGGMFGRGGGGSTWTHDYPRADMNFSKILDEVSTIRVRKGATTVVALDEPRLFEHAVAYLVEPGYWVPNEAEVSGLRKWLKRGGFLIVDDFRGNERTNLITQLKRVLPEAVLQPIPRQHPIFDSFYHFTEFDGVVHPYSGYQTEFWGIFENNDPRGRLMVIANVEGDVSEYWEFSDEGFAPIAVTNTAYKLGVNYMIYALTR